MTNPDAWVGTLSEEERAIFSRAASADGAGTVLSTCNTVRFMVQNYGRQLLVRVNASQPAEAHARKFCAEIVTLPPSSESQQPVLHGQFEQCVSYITSTTRKWRNILASVASCVLDYTHLGRAAIKIAAVPASMTGSSTTNTPLPITQLYAPLLSACSSCRIHSTAGVARQPTCPVLKMLSKLRIYVYDDVEMPARFLRGYDRLQHQTDMYAAEFAVYHRLLTSPYRTRNATEVKTE